MYEADSLYTTFSVRYINRPAGKEGCLLKLKDNEGCLVCKSDH